jgi:hypothetical protein
MLAASRGRPYAQALIQRACGPIVAMTLDPVRFDREIAAVRASLNQSVVVETSALTTATLLPDRWPALRAVFAELVVPRNVLQDIQITGAELRRDPDSLSWIGFDPDQDVLTLTEPSPHQTSGFIAGLPTSTPPPAILSRWIHRLARSFPTGAVWAIERFGLVRWKWLRRQARRCGATMSLSANWPQGRAYPHLAPSP